MYRIIFCIGSLQQGGAERVVANLANEFIKKYDVTIITTVNNKPFYSINSCINYYTLDDDKQYKNYLMKSLKRIFKLIHLIKTCKPDIVISFLPEPTLRVLIARLFIKFKSIVSVRNDPNILYNTKFKKQIVKLLYPNSDGFVFQTEDAKKWFPVVIQNKSRIIPNPINEDFICEPFDGERDKSIVCVARLVKQKNHKLLINAFNSICKSNPEYKLLLYGDGPCKNELIELTNSLGLSNNVCFMGKCSNIKKEIYKAGIFTLVSDYEGMPNSLMEAMALGLPCISTDCPIGGPKFLIKNNYNGLLINVNDEKGLISAIELLIRNEDFAKKIGENANKICKYLSPNLINKMWEGYIMEVLNNEK